MTKLLRALVTSLFALATVLGMTMATAQPAAADACYSWGRTLRSGTSGADVAELQIRVAGWAGYGVNMTIDGQFGGQTQTAVANFQLAYGLGRTV